MSIKEILSPETLAKMGFYAIIGLIYVVRLEGTISNQNTKLDSHGTTLYEIKSSLKSDKDKEELQTKVMEARLTNLELKTSLMQQYLKDKYGYSGDN